MLTLAAVFWTAKEIVHKKMCLSIASGFGVGVLIKVRRTQRARRSTLEPAAAVSMGVVFALECVSAFSIRLSLTDLSLVPVLSPSSLVLALPPPADSCTNSCSATPA